MELREKEIRVQDMDLRKKEQDFLIDWLSDDLHIELEKEKSDFPNFIARNLLPKIILKLKKKDGK